MSATSNELSRQRHRCKQQTQARPQQCLALGVTRKKHGVGLTQCATHTAARNAERAASRAPLPLSSFTLYHTFFLRLLIAIFLVLIGLAVILGGLVSKTTPVGVVGFLIALSGVLTLIRSLGALTKGAPRAKSSRKSLSQRLDERWDQRDM